jgi:hypothetical protein
MRVPSNLHQLHVQCVQDIAWGALHDALRWCQRRGAVGVHQRAEPRATTATTAATATETKAWTAATCSKEHVLWVRLSGYERESGYERQMYPFILSQQ